MDKRSPSVSMTTDTSNSGWGAIHQGLQGVGGSSSSKSFIKVSLLFHKDHSEFELRETHTKISKTYIKT